MALVYLYVDENFSGSSLGLRSTQNDLSDFTNGIGFNWNDETSSIRVVSGTWEFFEHVNHDGARMTLGPGDYPNMHNFPVKDNELSSIKLISE
ncbi:MAG TPA: beta/gamma crystallin-related protein [Mesorhizobium sp.]|nr:beta/gamma crystallin-related protein [Mesorhizobium sp.]